jgi:sirohydrochlorin ferrochelatase
VTPPLVAVAHGSRDPRSAATIEALLDVLRAQAPELDVRTAFLDLSTPRLGEVLAALHGEGHREVVVTPLLLGSAYHARVDIPGAVHKAVRRLPRLDVRVSDVLGPDPLLESAALRRLTESGADPADRGLGVVLAAAGSSHHPANAAVHRVTRTWLRQTRWASATAAFAAAAHPDVPAAIASLRARGARRIAIGTWFLAPGLLPDRVIAATGPAALVAAPLGDAPEVAEVIHARYREATTAERARPVA